MRYEIRVERRNQFTAMIKSPRLEIFMIYTRTANTLAGFTDGVFAP